MFRQSITSTPLTSDVANQYFTNITGTKILNDVSFLATIRALVASRLNENESVNIVYDSSSYTALNISSVPSVNAVEEICGRGYLEQSNGTIVIHDFRSTQEDNLANLRLMETTFTKRFDEYYHLDKIKEFYRKSFNVLCFINPKKKNAIIFVENLDHRKLHYLQVSIPAFLPWYFDTKKDGISPACMELIYSLREISPDKYQKCIEEIAKQYDFKSMRIHQMLKGFETRFEQIECEKVRARIMEYDNKINSLNSEIGNIISLKNGDCIRLLGLEKKIADSEEDSEIMEYFLCNNKLYLENVNGTSISFAVQDYLTYFDTEMAERAIENDHSFVYNIIDGNAYSGITVEDMKLLMREIFVKDEPRLKIRFCAAYKFDLNSNVFPMSSHAFPYEFNGYMPNPHIDIYGCMGNYTQSINELLINHDYIGAIEQCIASCKSLNWGDSTVMSSFMITMWGFANERYSNYCIELPDKRVVNTKEAIQWLKLQDESCTPKTEEGSDE